jgi:RHS repeat-associated protein
LNLRVDLGYDSDSRLSQISRLAGPLQELVSRTEYAFAQGLLASITHRGAGGVILDQFLYQFDADGFLSQVTSDFAGETDYAYDSDGQLTGESSLLVSNTFSYDANGNRVGGGYVVGPGNRLLSDGTWSYSYDAEGNLVGKTHLLTGDRWTYRYDHRNQMTLAEKRDTTGAVVLLAVYQYDVFGNRIEKSVDFDGDGPNAAVVTRYVLDGWNNSKPTPIGNEHFDIHAELDGANQLIARYLHGDEFDQTFARVDLRAANASERVLWYLTDHLNSVRLVLDESGGVLDQIAYDAFGNIVARLNPLVDHPLLFTSREFDAETGLYYNRARYLDPHHRPLDYPRPAGLRRRRCQPVSLRRQPGHAGHRPEREHRLVCGCPTGSGRRGLHLADRLDRFGFLSHDRQLVGCRHLGSLLGWAAPGNPSQCQRAGQCGSLAADAGGVE